MDAVLSQIFVDAENRSIPFFVDPDCIHHPKLIRLLKSQGASIASDPKLADFILVQGANASGQHFIRNWGAEKRVLESAWVGKCLSAGRLLREKDQWGECLAKDDPSIVLEDLENPLPTPRVSPVQSGNTIHPSNFSFNTVSNDHSMLYASQQPSGINEPLFPSNIPAAPPGFVNQIPQFSQQNGAQTPFYNFQPLQMQHQVVGNDSLADPNFQANLQMALYDFLQQRGLYPQTWNGGLPLAPGIQNGAPVGPFLMQGVESQKQSIYSQPPNLIPPAHDHSAPPPSSTPQFSSVSHMQRSTTDQKGKGKVADSRRSSSSFGPTAGSSSALDHIFTSEFGDPLTFYVAIDVNKRADVVHQIKRNGGQISTKTTANFAILSYRSKDFETLLETVLSSNGTPVKPAFVSDSVAQNTLLDPSAYKYETSQTAKNPRLPAKTDEEKKQAANLRRANRRKIQKEEGRAVIAVKKERLSPGLTQPRVPSPSPPPESNRVNLGGAKYRYTPEEEQYVLAYCQVLFARDRQLSYSALASKLHTKMPHHTVKAWNHRISQTMREDIEQVRKRVLIQWRKEQHQQSQQSNGQAEPSAKRAKLSSNTDTKQPRAGADDMEQDLSAVAHFFANGAGAEGGNHWEILTERTPCKTETSWEAFYDKHHDKVRELYEMLISTAEASKNSA